MIDNFTDIELENEQWRDIDGYEGVYQVSDLGRVRSCKSGEWKVLRPGTNSDGYLTVQLWRNGQGKTKRVHRLVAQAFIPNDDNSKTLINHINECKSENRFWNLEWCSAQYNTTYNDIRHRCWINRNDYKRCKIKSLYQSDLTIKQNIEVFRTNGIECCERTVRNLRKDLGLTRYYRPRKKIH